MIGFRIRLKAAIERSPTYQGNIWKLSEDAGLGRKTVYNMVTDKKLDHSKTGPGVFGLSRVASLLDVSLDYLMGAVPSLTAKQPQSNSVALATHALEALSRQSDGDEFELSADFLLRLHKKSGGRIEAFAPYLDRCDQYQPPKPNERFPIVTSVGARSLSSLTLGTSSVELLQSGFASLDDEELLSETMSDYRQAVETRAVSAVISRDLPMPNQPVWIKMDILRTLLLVETAEGEQSLLLFAFIVI
ncbi:hypothetical protein [Ascidiaceihabitans sp.]|uniref:hypothetical protein n=1 Tax=Ascidiaceihabitans sp. TaxID=1872644 RepID=UPI00329965B1